MKKKKKNAPPDGTKLFTEDMDYAFDNYRGTVQCGDCYVWYGAVNYNACPNCGGTEWVGIR